MVSHVVCASVSVLVACGGAPKPPPVSVDELARSSAPAIVSVIAGNHEVGGIVVDQTGLIATTLHAIEGQSKIQVVLHDRTEHPVVAIEGYDKGRDLALVRIEHGAPLPTLRLGTLDSVKAGEVVYEVAPTRTRQGIVEDVRVLSPNLTILMVKPEDGSTWAGPLFNTRGEVVALAAGYLPAPNDKVIAVPASYIPPMIARRLPMSVDQFAAASAPASPGQSQFPTTMPPVRKPEGWKD